MFWGAGPMVGVAVLHQIGPYPNVRIFGDASGGAMFGELEYDAKVVGLELESSDALDSSFSEDDFHTVAFLDATAGLSIKITPNVLADVGYGVHYVTDVVRTVTSTCFGFNTCAADDPGHGRSNADVLSHGPFFRVTMRF